MTKFNIRTLETKTGDLRFLDGELQYKISIKEYLVGDCVGVDYRWETVPSFTKDEVNK